MTAQHENQSGVEIYSRSSAVSPEILEKPLPSWILNENGKLFFDTSQLPDLDPEKVGPWDYVIDFGHNLEKLQEATKVDEIPGSASIVLGENWRNGEISQPFLNITHLANLFPLDDPDIQLLYTANFVIGMREKLHEAVTFIGKDALVLAPERGGRILKIMLGAMGFPDTQMPNFQASRIHGPDNSYVIAVRFDDPLPEEVHGVLHADDCGAGGGTEWADFGIFESLFGIPEHYAAVMGVGVLSMLQQRADELEQNAKAAKLYAAAISHSMNPNFYLWLTEEEKEILNLPQEYKYRVGDMGTAMSFESEERQAEIPLYQLLTTNTEFDDDIVSLTQQVIDGTLSKSDAVTIIRTWLSV